MKHPSMGGVQVLKLAVVTSKATVWGGTKKGFRPPDKFTVRVWQMEEGVRGNFHECRA